MQLLQNSTHFLYNFWTIPIRLNGKITGIYALQAPILSTLALIQKAYSEYAMQTPRIDHAIHLLKNAQQVLSSVPLTFICLEDFLQALRKLPQNFTSEALCKNASLLSALCAYTISLLQFIDQHGGQAVVQCVEWDKMYLNGMVTRIGQSQLFLLCHMNTLGGFKDGMTILSALLTIAQAPLTHKRMVREIEQLQLTEENLLKFKEDQKRLCFLNIACATCRIASVFLVGTTWPVLCFGAVSAVLHVSKELY